MTSITASSTAKRAALLPLVMRMLVRDKWSRDRLLSYQQARLRKLIAHAVAASPYYRETLGPDAATGDVPLEELPTLSKATVLDHFDRMVTDPRLRRTAVDAHLAGQSPGEPLLGRYQVFATSGTSGERGLFVHSIEELTLMVAATAAHAFQCGLTSGTRLVGIGSGSPFHISRHITQRLETLRSRRVQAPPQLSATMPLAEMVAALNAYQPEVLISYASLAGLLAEEQIRGALRIAPIRVCCGAEVLSDHVRQRIWDAWGLHPLEVYGATEAIAIAGSCPQNVGMHVREGLVVIEAVDEHNRPVPPGTPSHKVLLTNLTNMTQPLLRYELSDSITMADGPNPTGRPYQRIAKVGGRTDDTLRLPASGGGEVALHPLPLTAPFCGFPEVCEYQILHDGTRLDVRVVLRASAAPDTPPRVRATLLGVIERTGALPIPVDVTPVPAIDREPGPGAKLKLVKSVPPARTTPR